MSNNNYLFPLPEVITVPVQGSDTLYPVYRIFCVGRNYEAHAKEMGVAVDREAPFYFTKSRDTIVPSGARIPYPPGTKNYHYEMEFVVALGDDAFEVSLEDTGNYIYGYACGLDMTRRDLQLDARAKGRPWDLGKDLEQSAVISPIVPASEIGHPTAGAIELSVNDEVRQSNNIANLIWSVPELVSHLSRYYHLRAGDLIFTGTPEGVGAVQAGDRLLGRVEGVGTVELFVV